MEFDAITTQHSFPDGFMFKLTRDEVDGLVKCQIVTSRIMKQLKGMKSRGLLWLNRT